MLSRDEISDFLDKLELSLLDQPGAKQIKTAWRNLCKRFHPDKHPVEKYEEYLEKCKEASEKGEKYEGEVYLSQEEAQAKIIEVTHAYRMLTDVEYAFKDKRNGLPQVDLSVQVPLVASFQEGFFGETFAFAMAYKEFTEDGNVINYTEDNPAEPELVKVTVPKGAGRSPVYKKIIKGKGSKLGDKRGDLIAVVHFQADPAGFRYEGEKSMNLILSLRLHLHQMLKGDEIEVPSLYGVKTLKVPPFSKPGDKLTMKNLGIGKLGHLIVELGEPTFPDKEKVKDGENKEYTGLEVHWEMEEAETTEDDEDNAFMKIVEEMSKRNNAAFFSAAMDKEEDSDFTY